MTVLYAIHPDEESAPTFSSQELANGGSVVVVEHDGVTDVIYAGDGSVVEFEAAGHSIATDAEALFLRFGSSFYFVKDATTLEVDGVQVHSSASRETTAGELRGRVQIPRSKTLRCVVPVKNKSDVPGDCRLYVFVADAGVLSDPTGDLNADLAAWRSNAELEAQADFSIGGLETVEVTVDIPAADLSVGVKDVCLVLSVLADDEETLVAEKKVAAPIEIVEG